MNQPTHISKRYPLCRVDDMRPLTTKIFPLGRDVDGLPFLVLLVCLPNGAFRAYRNLCKHLPIPLSMDPNNMLSPDGKALQCMTHGALYHLEDGLCFHGDCEGESLDALTLEERDGTLFVLR